MRRPAVPVLAAALVLAACSAPGAAPEQDAGESETTSLSIATSSDVVTLDHMQRQNIVDLYVLDNVYDHLTKRARDGSVQPMLAESWTMADDGLSFTVELRDDVVFHDGTPMTAEDVEYSIMRLFDDDFPGEGRGDYEALEDTVVLDDYTVRFELNTPNPLFMLNTASRSAIVPKAYAESMTFEEFGQKGMGSGPYKIVQWDRDAQLVLEANEDYWQGAPAIDEVIFRPIPDSAARTAALLAGEADIVTGFEVEQIAALEGNAEYEVRQAEGSTRQRLVMNTNKPPFDDVRVREAVNLAIDTEAIIENVLQGTAYRAAGWTLPQEFGVLEGLEPYPYDPERSRELLAEAGYPDGFDVDFPVRSDYVKSAEVAQAIAADLEEVGIRTRIQMQERADFSRAQEAQELTFGYTGHGGGGTFEASFGFISAFHCWNNDRAHAGYFCDERIKEIVEAAPAVGIESGLDAMYDKYREGQQIVYDEYAQGTLWGQSALYGVNKDLEWDPSPDETMWIYEASW